MFTDAFGEISVDSAALLAQVYPVFLLLIVLESGRVAQRMPTNFLWSARLSLAILTLNYVVVAVSLVAAVLAVEAVVSDTPIPAGIGAGVVVVAGYLLFLSTTLVTGQFLALEMARQTASIGALKRLRADETPARHDR